MKASQTKVLVTGASGFLGSTFIKQYSSEFLITPMSLRNNSWKNTSFHEINCVLHCAALVHQMTGAPEEEYFKINVELTKQLAEKARAEGVEHFIYISSAHVYGDSTNLDTELNESSPTCPQDPYGASKVAAENILLSMEDSRFKVSIVRPPLIYGKGAKGNLILLSKIIRFIPFLPFAFDKNRRSMIFVGNLNYLISLVIKKKASGVFLPQDQTPVSLKTLTQEIAKSIGKKVLLFPLPKFLRSMVACLFPKYYRRLFKSLAFDSSETNKRLNYSAPYTLEQGLKDMFG